MKEVMQLDIEQVIDSAGLGPLHRRVLVLYALATLLDGYGARALRRVWKAVRFSWWMTTMLHTFHDAGEFEHRMQETELDYLAGSLAAQTAMAENYTGLPF